MIITRTPYRISLVGGGSDIPDYYLKHGGAVVSLAIDKYIYLTIHPYFERGRMLLKYSKTEQVDDVSQIEHPIIRAVFRQYDLNGVDLVSVADIPAGTGLGSSSAFTVGLINTCNAYTQQYMSKHDAAELACDIEINRLGEPIGKQDQYAASYGGLNYISFNKDDSVSVEPISLGRSLSVELQNSLLLFYLGKPRQSRAILDEQKQGLTHDEKRQKVMADMVSLAGELRKSLCSGKLDDLGPILHEGWMLKKKMAEGISTPDYDAIYELAMRNGAVGGKLLGAGGGGFFLFFCPQARQKRLIEALAPRVRHVPFAFDHIGSIVIYNFS